MSEAKNSPGSNKTFPKHLKKPSYSADLSKWLGEQLKKNRKTKTVNQIAREIDESTELLENFENGNFAINLGKLREVLKNGYRTSLTKLLSQYYRENREMFDPGNNRPFERDSHYSVCREPSDGRPATPFFICGDAESYVWAVPLRTLKKQPILTDLLELAAARKTAPRGITPTFENDGVEVIYVIYGTVELHIQGTEDEYTRKLRAGEFVHFRSSRPHRVQNVEKGLSALLLIVRLPKNSESGKDV